MRFLNNINKPCICTPGSGFGFTKLEDRSPSCSSWQALLWEILLGWHLALLIHSTQAKNVLFCITEPLMKAWARPLGTGVTSSDKPSHELTLLRVSHERGDGCAERGIGQPWKVSKAWDWLPHMLRMFQRCLSTPLFLLWWQLCTAQCWSKALLEKCDG